MLGLCVCDLWDMRLTGKDQLMAVPLIYRIAEFQFVARRTNLTHTDACGSCFLSW